MNKAVDLGILEASIMANCAESGTLRS